MKEVMRVFWISVCFCMMTVDVGFGAQADTMAKEKEFRIERSIPEVGVACIQCHKQVSPGIFADWANSRHASANITCIDCHQAEEFDPDVSKAHYKQYEQADTKYGRPEFKIPVTAVVTPKDCSRCHPDEAKQFSKSKHANTLEIIWKIDPWLNDGMNSEVRAVFWVLLLPWIGAENRKRRDFVRHLAECGGGAGEPGRQPGELFKLSYPSPIFHHGSPKTRSLRPVPPGTGSSTDRNLHGIQTWGYLYGIR